MSAVNPMPCYEGTNPWGASVLARPSKLLFSAAFDRLIRDRGVKAKDLVPVVGKAESTISRWRDGIAQPSFEDMDKIAEYFGVPVSYFYIDATDERSIGMDEERALMVLAERLKKRREDDDGKGGDSRDSGA